MPLRPYVYRFLAAGEPDEYRESSRDALVEGLRELIEAMPSSGPFFTGSSISAIDLHLVPFAYRVDALLGYYRGFGLPADGPTWSRYAHWYESICATAPFRATATAHANYRERLIQHYLSYSQGKGQQDVTQIQ